MRRMRRLDGQAAVIVGGSSGFGEDIARRFVSEGAEVLIAARGREKLEKVAAELGVASRVCDATSWDQLRDLAADALERFGHVDVAVNCAGYEHSAPVASLEPENVEKMVAVQFTGALYFLQHMANAMVATEPTGGSIVTISSLTATLVAEGYAPYAGAKAGINHATRIAASEYGAQGVRLNVVSPTTVETPMVAQLFATPGVREAMVAETPLGELPGVADVTNAVLFLASDESAFITGENIHLDGGGQLRRLPRTPEIIESIQRKMAEETAKS
jgi:NAD(P)-dependent dehydrogenase (short-subunit alcohol dehydrogenase family)